MGAMSDYRLAAGPHRRPGTGRCAMEWVAHLAGEPHSDAPRAVSPVVAAFARALNDALGDADRQRLRPYLARSIGTAGDGRDAERARECSEWLARECAPAMLEHAGLDRATTPAAAAAARARRRRPVYADGARHAVRAAARTAGWDAALAAVRAAPEAGLEREAAVARGIVRDACWAAAWRDGPSPWERMRPVARSLQRSTFALLDRLLAVQQSTMSWNGSSCAEASVVNVFTSTSCGAEVPPLATLRVAPASGSAVLTFAGVAE
jgi:hypothetical protein